MEQKDIDVNNLPATKAGPRHTQHHGLDRFKEITEKFFEDCAGEECQIVGVMGHTSPYPERKESRIRNRIAVLAGMGVHGFAPYQGEHIGYLRWNPEGSSNAPSHEIAIPFELFKRESNDPNNSARKLLLWIPEEPFAQKPIERFKALRELVYPKGLGINPRLRIIGPQSSETLKRLISEAHQAGTKAKGKGLNLTLHSASATMSTESLLKGIGKDGGSKEICREGRIAQLKKSPQVSERKKTLMATCEEERITRLQTILQGQGIRLIRSISSDDKLVDLLIDELAMRNADPSCLIGDHTPFFPPEKWCRSWSEDKRAMLPYQGFRNHIVLIAEWDTDYGRDLPRLFRRAVENRMAEADKARSEGRRDNRLIPPRHIHRFSYVKGLDGDLTQSDEDHPSPSPTKKEVPTLEDANEPAISSGIRSSSSSWY